MRGLPHSYAYVNGNPISLVDPFGLAPGDPYKTLDEAGTDAACFYNPISVLKDQEYAGFLYQNPDGTYSYTRAYPGDSESSGLLTALSNYPQTPVAWFHTHGAYEYQYGPGQFQYSNIQRVIAGFPMPQASPTTWRIHGITCIDTTLIRDAEDEAAFTTMVSVDVQNDQTDTAYNDPDGGHNICSCCPKRRHQLDECRSRDQGRDFGDCGCK